MVADRFWRMLSIRWQREPLAGTGAARNGGRWNRRGRPALYLSADQMTAIAEFHQAIVIPGTLVGYDVRSETIVDLTSDADLQRLGIDAAVRFAEWRALSVYDHGDPPGWAISDRLIADGADGALVPSARHRGGVNLVLWRWSTDGSEGARVTLVDPRGDLG